MLLASVIFTAEELASLAQSAAAFSQLIAKIQSSAPDVWASVQSDFAASVALWNNAGIPPAPIVSAAAPVAAQTTYSDASALSVGQHVQAVAEPAPVVVAEPVKVDGAAPVAVTEPAPVTAAEPAPVAVAEPTAAEVASALQSTSPGKLAQIIAILRGVTVNPPHDVAAVVNAAGVYDNTPRGSDGSA
jgi:hypothetical protein